MIDKALKRIEQKKIWKRLREQLLCITQAALDYSVPKFTLGDRVHGRVQQGSRSGPEWLLSDTEEAELVAFVIRCSAIGYPKTRKDMIELVHRIAENSLSPELTSGEIPGTIYGLSDKEWIDQELLKLWFHHHFLRYAPAVRPLLLFMDGHSLHYSTDTIHMTAK